jgi:hypothetical protein
LQHPYWTHIYLLNLLLHPSNLALIHFETAHTCVWFLPENLNFPHTQKQIHTHRAWQLKLARIRTHWYCHH